MVHEKVLWLQVRVGLESEQKAVGEVRGRGAGGCS